MTENVTTDGFRRVTPPTPSASDKKPLAQEPPSQHSTLPHKQIPESAPQKTEADKLSEVQALLRGETVSPQGGDDENDTATLQGGDAGAAQLANSEDQAASPSASEDLEGSGTGTYTIKELAEQLGTSPKKLYEALQITTVDGETLSLGAVKDRIQQQETAAREIVQKETAIAERESVLLQNMQLLQSVYADLQGKLSPETVNQLQQQTTRKQQQERQLMHQAMPELSDPNQLEQFRNDVAETLTTFGFQPSELVINDHRIALVLRDYMRTKRQLAKLMEFDPASQAKPPKAQRPQGRRTPQSRSDQVINRAKGGTQADKVAAAGAILRKGQGNGRK